MTGFDDLIARARGGDEGAFVVLFRTYQPLLLRYLRGVAPAEYDDLAGDIWVSVVRGLREFSGDESGFRGWLFTIARRRVVDMRRTRGRRPEVLSAEPPEHTTAPDAAWEVDQAFSTERAIALISELPAAQAEVVLLRVVGGLDVTAVAAIVGRRPATVRVQSHRGLRRLAEILAERDAAVTHPTHPTM